MLGDQGRAFGGHLQPRGASPPCGDSAFEATVQQRDRTFPGQDRSGPASLAIGGGPGLRKPSGLRGMSIGFVIVELLILVCTYCCCIYIPMYLPQAVSLPVSIEIASDLFWHAEVY